MKQSMINKRQYFILSFYLTRVLFLGIGFSVLVGISKNSLIISSFLGMLLGYFLLYLFYKKGSIGKIASISISIVTLLTGLLAITTLTGTYLLYDTPTLFIMTAFFIVLVYGATKEMKITSRVSEIFYPFSLFIILFGFLALLFLVNLFNLLPLFNTSFLNFVQGILVFTSTSLMPNLLLINYKDDLKFKDVGSGYLFGCILTLITMFFIISIYGSEFASTVRFPEYLILNKINIFNYVSNVENILVMEWVVNLTVGGLVCVKILKEHLSMKMFTVLLVLIVLGIEFILIRNYVNVLLFKRYIYYVSLGLVAVALLLKGKKNSN